MAARQITNIIHEGNGFRVTWSDGSISQFEWTFDEDEGRLRLANDTGYVTREEAEEVLYGFDICAPTAALQNKLFGVGVVAAEGLAIGQVGDAIPQNTWVRLYFDTRSFVRDDTGNVRSTPYGGIVLPYGIYYVRANVLMSDTGGVAVSDIAIHIYDEDAGIGIPGAFVVGNRLALANAPLQLSTSTILAVNETTCPEGGGRTFSIRARSASATTIFGAHASSIPSGSTNYAGQYSAFRIG